jgi:hypothetical protein
MTDYDALIGQLDDAAQNAFEGRELFAEAAAALRELREERDVLLTLLRDLMVRVKAALAAQERKP